MPERDWTAPIDAYCERLDSGFWSEPLNALSNLAFLLAAALAWRAWRRAGARDQPALLLIAIAAAVGTGSFLFHTVANRWSALADVLPIAAFIYAYFFLAMRRFLGLGLLVSLVITLAFLAFNSGFVALWRQAFGAGAVAASNGSLGYVPPALALFVVGGILWIGGKATAASAARWRAGTSLLSAAALFTVSLAFRTADQAVCGVLPIGTHFLWHILNAVVLNRLIMAAIEHGPDADQGSASTRFATARTSSGSTSKA